MEEFQFTGLQIATFSFAYSTGNANTNDLQLNLRGVEAIGTGDEIYTLRQTQQTGNTGEFDNGQFWELRGPDGDILARQLNPDDNNYQGLGATDEYIVFQGNSFGNVIISVNDLPTEPTDLTFTQADESGTVGDGDDDGNYDFTEAATAVPVCYVSGTLIDTPSGPRPVEQLKAGALVVTADGGWDCVTWTASTLVKLDNSSMAHAPVVVKKNALGSGCPNRDLFVSPQHRILLDGPEIELNFGTPEVFFKARDLIDGEGVQQTFRRGLVRYHHVLLSSHQVIVANGLLSESFFPGPGSVTMMSAKTRRSLANVLGATLEYGPLARPEAHPRLANVLQARLRAA
ncbi:hypothetical protein ROJ8625_00236 [Roseivivax jejudonensis]|uniref:Hedgehog/Intein (Hint) domain-containing protein n=1 Tax=Roseivivax jejudonensis TaxID=1529041 RepID=A0A1X6Y5P5_9RHOB|nr:Hint domain-containing protein [Roseivivax jejudonensis]SLN11052.1 hypothetical protein ROJ8625_00236 [Roseivivax jejudonensis]